MTTECENSNPKLRRFTMRHLIAVAERYYGLPKGIVTSERKMKPVVLCRFMVCLIARRELGLSLTQIGQSVCRDHSTVLYAVEKAGELIKDKDFAADYEAIVALAAQRAERPFETIQVRAKPLIPPEEPTPEPKVKPAPTPRRREDICPPRRWWVENDYRFIEAMRAAYPEREIELEARP